ncbi:Inh minor capsid protein inhibitor of 21 protease [Escherichia phage RB43]|uniref:Inh minor capsid protein inhibitor of 21 protease n=1 Tax=Escherichia phage RB43 TaxID=2887182 RepID=Q56BG5_9CAUD|nr:minor head protein inhibitor of protease [Escherichia phage RB43]AAX78756.1 Inh minor capsid protein inhibitor of 21 protease [Escherichia phage RB43]
MKIDYELVEGFRALPTKEQKGALADYAQSTFEVKLNKQKSFDNMLADLEAAVPAEEEKPELLIDSPESAIVSYTGSVAMDEPVVNAPNIPDVVVDVSQDFMDYVKDVAPEVADQIKLVPDVVVDVSQDFMDYVKDVAPEVADQIKLVPDVVVDVSQDFMDYVKDVAPEVADQIKLVPDVVVDVSQDFMDYVKDVAPEVADQIKLVPDVVEASVTASDESKADMAWLDGFSPTIVLMGRSARSNGYYTCPWWIYDWIKKNPDWYKDPDQCPHYSARDTLKSLVYYIKRDGQVTVRETRNSSFDTFKF